VDFDYKMGQKIFPEDIITLPRQIRFNNNNNNNNLRYQAAVGYAALKCLL
jgi:hypothetical protein